MEGVCVDRQSQGAVVGDGFLHWKAPHTWGEEWVSQSPVTEPCQVTHPGGTAPAPAAPSLPSPH